MIHSHTQDAPESEPSPTHSVDNLIDLKKDEPDTVLPSVPSVDAAIAPELKSNSLPFQKSLPLPTTSSFPMLIKTPSKIHVSSSMQNFSTRTVKHHSFDSDLDVKYMEKNLISLLDDFHNGES